MAKKKKKEKSFSSFLNNSIDFTLLVSVLLLLALGLIMVLSASSPSALAQYGDSYSFFSKQLIFAILGIVAMLFISESGNSYRYFSRQLIFAIAGLVFMMIISKIDYRFYQKFYKYALVFSILLLAITLLVGREINGAKRWIYVTESLSVQPSEIVKFLMIIFYAGLLTKDRDNLPKYGKGFVLHLIPLVPVIGLLLLQPHFSASIVIIGICSIIMIIAGCKFWHFLVTGITFGVPTIIAIVTTAQYRLQRVVTFLDPWKDATGDGWQVIQSLYAIGSGGLFGVGLGESKQKFLYIPEPHNDFIFSILGEELGFVGCAFVIILFAIFVWRGIVIAMRAPDMFGSLVAIGIVSLVAIQVIINIAVVTSSMPATGMPLPFFSYGGTALFILLCEVGVLLNISRASAKQR